MATKSKTSRKSAPQVRSLSKASAARSKGSATKASGKPKMTKLALLVARLSRPRGATIVELCKATGWQAHSVRGALAGALRKKGHVVRSEKTDGPRRYRIAGAAQ